MNIKQQKIISTYFPDLKDLVDSRSSGTVADALAMAIVNKIETLKGEKGDDGNTPVKGKDYWTDKEIRDISNEIRDTVVTPYLIKQATPVKGKDYFDGESYVLTERDKSEIAKKVTLPPKVDKIIERTEVIREVSKPVDVSMVQGAVSKKELEYENKKILDGMAWVQGRIKLIDQRWGGKGLSSVSHDSTLTGLGTPNSPLSVIGGGSGGGFSIITVSGIINDANMTFTAPSQPSELVINGAAYQQAGGAYTWSYAGGTITLSSPIGSGGSIYGHSASTSVSGTWYQDEIVATSSTASIVNLLNTPQSVVFLYLNGQYLTSGIGRDYTRVGKTITLTTALVVTDVLTANYL